MVEVQSQQSNALLVTISSQELELSLAPGVNTAVPIGGAPNTLTSMTIYIDNSTFAPSTGTAVSLYITDWKTGVTTNLALNQYRYGFYVENMPIGSLTAINQTSLNLNIYCQYTIKNYAEPYNTAFQILTQLVLLPNIITQTLTGGTNFRYQGTIASLNMSLIPTTIIVAGVSQTNVFYVLDQQIYGTNSSAAGSVSVPWTAEFTDTINVPAVGAAEDSTLYSFAVDSTSQSIPSNVTSTNAVMNWVKLDFYSPLSMTLTGSSSQTIIYNTGTSMFTDGGDTVSVSCFATNMTGLLAAFTVLTNSMSTPTNTTVPATVVTSSSGNATFSVIFSANPTASSYPTTNVLTCNASYVPASTSISAVTTSSTLTITYSFSYTISTSYSSPTFTATVVDSASTAINNIVVGFVGTNCTVSAPTAVTNSSGQASVTVSAIGSSASVTASTTLLGVLQSSTTGV